MRFAPRIPTPRPPRLSMDEYLDFVEATIKESNPHFAGKQKELEKRITKPFRMEPRGSSTDVATGR